MAVTASQVGERLRTLMNEADAKLEQFEKHNRAAIEAEHEYKMAHAKAYLVAEGPNKEHRTAKADEATADLRFAFRMSEGLAKGALEALRLKRDELSAFQSYVSTLRTEMELARTAPQRVA